MDRQELLKGISFGARVAEDETSELANYFVETDQWQRILRGDVDIVRGDKGAGKSAIYSLLLAKDGELFDKKILLTAAETPRGTPIFKELTTEPPATEAEFVGLWKLYIITIIAETAHSIGISNAHLNELRERLIDQGLVEKTFSLPRLLKTCRRYARSWFKPTIEGGVTVDPTTGLHTYTAKITPGEPSAAEESSGAISIGRLAELANRALETSEYRVWVLLDRLDVAFADTKDLERNALRALFRVYLDFSNLDQIRLKIFIRSDIWNRITEGGFREASHITRDIEINWSQDSLLNLIVRRILKNDILVKEWGLDRNTILANSSAQNELFYRLFPKQVDQGPQKPESLRWIVSRCADGSGNTAPREVIHLLNTIREEEVQRLERGNPLPPENRLFDRSVFKSALPTVSRTRLVQTLYAEYPQMQEHLAKLKGEKTEQTPQSLSKIWAVNEKEALLRAEELVEIGFFQRKGSKEATTYWVPFLYRDGLEMVQGKDEGE